MSLKDKLTSLLFGSKPEEETLPEDIPPAAAAAEAAPAAPDVFTPPPDQLELPPDHPIYQLYDLYRREAGYLPAPRLRLDEAGVLPEELVHQEKGRVQAVLTRMCHERLKQLRRGGQKKDEEEVSLDAQACFLLSNDKLQAWALVFPPAGEGEELTKESFRRALLSYGIAFGVNEQLADRLYREDRRYLHLFLIAQGKPAFDGANGNIVDYFPRTAVRIMEADEYDRVDYANLNLIHNVKQGEEICRLIRPTDGEPGRTVLNQEIPARSGKSVPLPKGRNTEISDDGTLLLASISGDVEFTGRSFQVKPVLDIPGNVDFSTGNISFLGDVNIRGDVLAGFTVRAMGNIQVGGVVEAGSTVEAGGDLIVVKGILGDGSSVIRAQRSLFSKYIENSTIYVRENLQTDCIVNSQVYSDGEVLVRSGRGAIIGGRIWAARKVSAMAVGARSECRTAVALGGLPCTNFERDIMRQRLEQLAAELEKLEAQVDSASKVSLMDKTRAKLSVTELKLRQLESELADIKISAEERDSGRLECGIIYPGAEISIGDAALRIRQERRQCSAVLVHGEIELI